MTSRLILGTAQFGLDYGVANTAGRITKEAGRKILLTARQEGIRRLDTAIAYGISEQALGEYGVTDFEVISKLPAVPEDCKDAADWVEKQVFASLARLNVPVLDGLLFHRPDQLLGPQGKAIVRSLEQLVADQLVKKTGLSVYSPETLHAFLSACPVDIIQAPFNLFDQRLITSGWLPRLKAANIEVHTRSAFLQGLLLMPENKLPSYFAPWKTHIARWYNWLNKHPEITATQACLSAPLLQPGIDAVVVGVDNADQLRDIISMSTRTTIALPDFQIEDIELIDPSNWRIE